MRRHHLQSRHQSHRRCTSCTTPTYLSSSLRPSLPSSSPPPPSFPSSHRSARRLLAFRLLALPESDSPPFPRLISAIHSLSQQPQLRHPSAPPAAAVHPARSQPARPLVRADGAAGRATAARRVRIQHRGARGGGGGRPAPLRLLRLPLRRPHVRPANQQLRQRQAARRLPIPLPAAQQQTRRRSR